MDPEERARANIDSQLRECGWQVQDYRELNIIGSKGVAVREFPVSGAKEADFLLYADGKAIGVVEAKPEEWTLKGVEPEQAPQERLGPWLRACARYRAALRDEPLPARHGC